MRRLQTRLFVVSYFVSFVVDTKLQQQKTLVITPFKAILISFKQRPVFRYF